ncbi:unnamed protein product [Rotaria socialis]|uniref:HAT C-terminal dimerisation domain-containing protein n=5 Tax=Rotaria socialis TaxID=392032 RepID=A0A820X147_9BILA|nr:unnamed protein product [Rotaria socialis]CAF4527193.1 unnamed protein product [Rotaria socialis]
MSKQNSLDKYFVKRKENNETNKLAKRFCVENENIITPSNIVASQPDHSTVNKVPPSDIQFIHNNSVSSKTLTNNTHPSKNNSELKLGSPSINDRIDKRSYKPSYSQKFPWLLYQPNVGGFCSICRNYWKPGTPLFREMEQKTKGVFTSAPFRNWKNALGDNGRLMRHFRSEYHLIAHENDKFRQQEGSIINQIVTVSEAQKKENRDRLSDLLDCCYFLFKNELPHTTLYHPLLQLIGRLDHSSKLADFFQNCHKNATYNSTTSVTELLEATNNILEKNVLKKIQQARVISIMSDEGTDINRHGNLCICIRYCDQTTGEPTETYISLLHLKNKDAESIFNCIVTDLQQKHIDLTKIRFVAFDGAAVFSGIRNGVAAKFRAAFNLAILFIHCRAHALQLAVISAADGIPDICKSLSTLKSLVNFINRSSIRLTLFEDVQDIFISKHIKLIQPGDTRWLSNSLSIRSIVHSYQSLLVTLENIYNENNEDSAEALGLYNILSNQATAFIIHTLQPILDTLAVLSKSIQTKAADFKQLQDFISSTMLRLEELKDFSSIDYVNILETIQKLSLVSSTIRNSRSSISNVQLNTDEVFKSKILPFIENIINNIQARFEPSNLDLLNCFMIFDMENMNDNKDYGDKEIHTIQQHYSNDFDESIIYEWRTFRTYLLTKKKGGKLMTQREVCTKLVQDGMLKDIYPQLSLAAEIFLIAPISTATVERDFSTMNRVLTKLRNRLTTEHVDQLMRISIEGVDTLNEDMKEEIINYWKKVKPRRLAV